MFSEVQRAGWFSPDTPLQPGSGSRIPASKGCLAKIVPHPPGRTRLPNSAKIYLAHIHPGTCAEEEGGGAEHGHSHHEHGATEEIEYPLTPVEPDAEGNVVTSTTVVHGVTLEGLLSGDPKHVNVHKPGSGEPLPVSCADLNEAL